MVPKQAAGVLTTKGFVILLRCLLCPQSTHSSISTLSALTERHEEPDSALVPHRQTRQARHAARSQNPPCTGASAVPPRQTRQSQSQRRRTLCRTGRWTRWGRRARCENHGAKPGRHTWSAAQSDGPYCVGGHDACVSLDGCHHVQHVGRVGGPHVEWVPPHLTQKRSETETGSTPNQKRSETGSETGSGSGRGSPRSGSPRSVSPRSVNPSERERDRLVQKTVYI